MPRASLLPLGLRGHSRGNYMNQGAAVRFASTQGPRAVDNEPSSGLYFLAVAAVTAAGVAYFYSPQKTHESLKDGAGPAIAVPALDAPKPTFPSQNPDVSNAPASTVLLPKSPSDTAKMNATGPVYHSDNVIQGEAPAPARSQLDERSATSTQDSAQPPAEPSRAAEEPSSSEDVFANKASASYQVPYVLIGGGTACHFAMKAILEKDPKAKVLIITEDTHRPYARPPLSKEAWADPTTATTPADDFAFASEGEKRQLHYQDKTFYVSIGELGPGGVALMTERKVTELDPFMKRVMLDDNVVVYYDKCLLAPGGFPRSLKVFDEAEPAVREHVDLFRSVADFSSVDSAVHKSKRIAVIGGGFLGSELAAAIALRGKDSGVVVEQIIREQGPLHRVLPPYLSRWTAEELSREGVHVHPGCQVQSATPHGSGVRLGLSDGTTMDVDHVVVAVGLAPRTDIAETARLEIDPIRGGIVTNAELEARSDLWVAGDAASFFDISLGRRRVEHHDHAALTGRLAGQNMTGARRPFFDQSMFWSDIGARVSVEAVGLVDASLETVSVWAQSPDPAQKHHKGVVFYVRDKHVVGVLLWNVPRGIPAARKIIRSEKAFEHVRDLSRFFRLYDD